MKLPNFKHGALVLYDIVIDIGYIYDFMIDSLITVIYFCDVTPSSDWDSHSPNLEFLTSFNNR